MGVGMVSAVPASESTIRSITIFSVVLSSPLSAITVASPSPMSYWLRPCLTLYRPSYDPFPPLSSRSTKSKKPESVNDSPEAGICVFPNKTSSPFSDLRSRSDVSPRPLYFIPLHFYILLCCCSVCSFLTLRSGQARVSYF